MQEPAGTLQSDDNGTDRPADGQRHRPSRPPSATKFVYPSGSQPLEGFTLKRGIGVGGFGEVYYAISDAGKDVALKHIQRNLDVERRSASTPVTLRF